MCPITHVPHLYLYIIMAMCPITHVSHCPCAPLLIWPYGPCATLPYSHVGLEGSCHIAHMPNLLFPITPCAQSPYPCAHVPHCSCGLLPMHPITLLPYRSRISHATLPICPITPIPMSNGAHR